MGASDLMPSAETTLLSLRRLVLLLVALQAANLIMWATVVGLMATAAHPYLIHVKQALPPAVMANVVSAGGDIVLNVRNITADAAALTGGARVAIIPPPDAPAVRRQLLQDSPPPGSPEELRSAASSLLHTANVKLQAADTDAPFDALRALLVTNWRAELLPRVDAALGAVGAAEMLASAVFSALPNAHISVSPPAKPIDPPHLSWVPSR